MNKWLGNVFFGTFLVNKLFTQFNALAAWTKNFNNADATL